MASVSDVAGDSEKSAATFQTQLLSDPILGWRRISAETVDGSIRDPSHRYEIIVYSLR